MWLVSCKSETSLETFFINVLKDGSTFQKYRKTRKHLIHLYLLIILYGLPHVKMNPLKCRTLSIYNVRTQMLKSAHAIETQFGSVH